MSSCSSEEENHCSCLEGSVTVNMPPGAWLFLQEYCHLENTAFVTPIVKRGAQQVARHHQRPRCYTLFLEPIRNYRPAAGTSSFIFPWNLRREWANLARFIKETDLPISIVDNLCGPSHGTQIYARPAVIVLRYTACLYDLRFVLSEYLPRQPLLRLTSGSFHLRDLSP